MAPYCHLFSLDPDPVRNDEDEEVHEDDEANRRQACPLALGTPDCRLNAARNGVRMFMSMIQVWATS
jgi:hypothetical protein